MTPCVAVLGGSGLVGRALAATWPAGAPAALRLLLPRSRPSWLAESRVEARRVDLGSVDDLRAALDGATAVIDLVRPDGDGRRLQASTHVREALAGSRVRRLVHASSIDVYGSTPAPLVGPDTPAAPTSAYAREHVDAEAAALGGPVPTTVVRLGAVFGPGSANLVSLADEVAGAPAWRLALRRAISGPQRLHLVSLETVTAVLMALLEAHDPPSRLIVTDDAAPENDLAHAQDLLIAALHRPDVSRTPTLPRAVLRAALAWRGQAPARAHRRFAGGPLAALVPDAAALFPARLQAYVAVLAAERRPAA